MRIFFTLVGVFTLALSVRSQHNHNILSESDSCKGDIHCVDENECRPTVELEFNQQMTFGAKHMTQAGHEGSARKNVELLQRGLGFFRGYTKPGKIGVFACFMVTSTEEYELTGGLSLRFKKSALCIDLGFGGGISSVNPKIPVALQSYLAVTRELKVGKIEFFGDVIYTPKNHISYYMTCMLMPREWVGVGVAAQSHGVWGLRTHFGHKGFYFITAGGWNMEAKGPGVLFGIMYRRD